MSLKCDFCGKDSLGEPGDYFISNDNDSVHICEQCINGGIALINNAKAEKITNGNNSISVKKTFSQAINETKIKHADVIDGLARHD